MPCAIQGWSDRPLNLLELNRIFTNHIHRLNVLTSTTRTGEHVRTRQLQTVLFPSKLHATEATDRKLVKVQNGDHFMIYIRRRNSVEKCIKLE
ncbi:hypothetical protein EVAR_80990_1 [Eumeta japonica]|uniref:Uncharacterized protein n=1 Tax=Eumeta variegata TaxID=151549 RepID=A0A4C1WNS0_EUMVA|nr:hypothetical protein EVAR_80990_1 [Eumeta japonica]